MTDTNDPLLRATLGRGLVSRRSALAGVAGLGAVGLLAACGSAGKNPAAKGASGAAGTAPAKTAAAAAKDLSDTDKVLNWSNWSQYIDVSDDGKRRPTLEAFMKQTGIKVNYVEDYNDNDEFYAKVRPLLEGGQDTGRDVWVSTDWMVSRLIRQGYVQELDMANIPHVDRLLPALQNVRFDPGRRHSLPWQSGFTGVAYNTVATGGKKVESMEQLLTDKSLKGKVALLTEMQDTMGLVLLELGKDPASFTDADFQQAIDMISQAKDSGQIQAFTGGEYTSGLTKGDIAACTAWTGDIVQLQFDKAKVEYVLPKKGFMLWSDNFVIPALAKHKKNAERLINYYYDPVVMAKVAAFVNYIPPITGTKAELVKIDKGLGDNPLITPSDEVLSRAHVFQGLSPEQEAKYTRMFSNLTAS